ncbi:GNAT family N-acetyltransferase [Aquihabitans sp. G128]|uniref:GNAT family N-acetyltransferase n=1 Tax=Aquihabitans sp. G128 TaxID=2849779 RepID=UPI001C231114|nr:GNAT family N-acetyltransferase [Aquihabitans sp. G128]QXC62786.1 GNAT family N-acetyltransferase [Aquihabitans sp. G128]
MEQAAVDEVSWRIRPAEARDVDAIDRLVRALAEYEREPDAVEATPEDFRSALFGPDPKAFAHVAEVAPAGASADDPEAWRVVGMALWFVTFSTWKGRHGLWLEDLFVEPEHRRLGLGRALLATLAAVCDDRGWPRFEWWVLDWNEPAHRFYASLGAVPQDEWTVWRVDGDALSDLASGPA